MKKTLVLTIIITALSLVTVSAQTTGGGSCTYDQVKQNYNTCCFGTAATANQFNCTRYTLEVGSQNTLSGGAPSTLPTNNQNQRTSGTITPTPQAGSAELKSCSVIRFESILDILIWAKCIISVAIIPLLFTLAFLFFLWGMITYIRNSDDIKKREESKNFIYWGILGLTVMVGVWGIIRIVTTTFGLGNTVPQLQTDCLTTDKNNKCR